MKELLIANHMINILAAAAVASLFLGQATYACTKCPAGANNPIGDNKTGSTSYTGQ